MRERQFLGRNGHDGKRRPRRPDKPAIEGCGKDYGRLMAEAKIEFDAWMQRQLELGKGGRPKGSKPRNSVEVSRGRPVMPNVESNPADALLSALGHYSGSAA